MILKRVSNASQIRDIRGTWVDCATAASVLGVSRQYVDRQGREGKAPAIVLFGKLVLALEWVVDPSALWDDERMARLLKRN